MIVRIWFRRLLIVSALAWLASGTIIVRSDERAVIRRFGRVVAVVEGGVHFVGPWPVSRVDRVNIHAVRSVSIDTSGTRTSILTTSDEDVAREFLTADRNFIRVRGSVQYRVSDPAAFVLAGDVSPRLTVEFESALTEVLSRTPVDRVYPSGLSTLRSRLTTVLQDRFHRLECGILLDDVQLVAVEPPPETAAAFAEAANARSRRDRDLAAARTAAERQIAFAESQAAATGVRAGADAAAILESAKGRADRFRALVGRVDAESQRSGNDRAVVSRRLRQRMYWETVMDLIRRFSHVFVIDGDRVGGMTVPLPLRDAPANPGGKLANPGGKPAEPTSVD
jgi:membrane protease subunit HflK